MWTLCELRVRSEISMNQSHLTLSPTQQLLPVNIVFAVLPTEDAPEMAINPGHILWTLGAEL